MSATFLEEPWLHKHSRSVLIGLSVIGVLITGYLTFNKLTAGDVAFCGTGAGCDLVLSSRWATFLGLPTALLGLAGYAAVAVLAALPQSAGQVVKQWRWPALFALTTGMFVFELYMLYLMIGVIRAFCLYCSIAIALTTAIWIVTLSGRQWIDMGKLTFNGLLVAIATVVVTVGVYGSQTPPPSQLAVGLAEHLKATGTTMYGAHWCPHCEEQKSYFGSAFKDVPVPYVECSPNGGPGTPPAQACIDKGVQSYPTWFINDDPHPGLRPLEELAQLTGYEIPESDEIPEPESN